MSELTVGLWVLAVMVALVLFGLWLFAHIVYGA